MKHLFACRFRQVTGLPCPSCGSTRALGALLRFDAGRAIRLNPIALVAASLISVRLARGDRRAPSLEGIAVVVLALGLIRAIAVALGMRTPWTAEHLPARASQ